MTSLRGLAGSVLVATLVLGAGLSAAPAQDAAAPAAPAQAAPAAPAAAGEPEWRYSTSLVGEPKYPKDFAHFDYVNADAPKGGLARLSVSSVTFDTLNPILPQGNQAAGLGLVYETLMMSSLDELDNSAEYPQLAEAMRYPDDYGWVTYRLNPNAKWHDGEPVTADDVVWSFNKTIELNPSQKYYYQHVVKVEKTGDREVTFTFDQTGNRELPHILGQLMVLPQHWWEGKDARGNQRDIARGTLEPPLGSGPYKVGAVIPGRTITYERVPDFWGADLNTYVGQNNFDRIRYEYYRDRTVEFEAFKADEFDYWFENEAKRWATGYDVPPVTSGRINKQLVELEQVSGSMVGFVPNLRRPQFQDRRVRQAINYAFDFEELNRTQFYGQYTRIDSFFFGLDGLRWTGLPEGKELEILESVRDKVPAEVFTEEYRNPVGGNPQLARDNLRKAVDLLTEAGYTLQGNRMIGPDGKQLSFELLLNGDTIARVALPLQTALKRIGVDMQLRTVDSTQYVNRLRSRDYDMIYAAWGESNSPGNEQSDFWGSASADSNASRNYAGIKDPAVDELIRRVIYTADRDELVAAVHALDRVLMWNQYVIPSYTILADRLAWWDRFGHPDPFPRFDVGFPTVWWYDEAKAAKVGVRQ